MNANDLTFPPYHDLMQDKQLLLNVKGVVEERCPMMMISEVLNLYRTTKRILKIEGDIAEVGVFAGGSAKIIALASEGKKPIHLFDTFEGIAEITPGLDSVGIGDFSCTLENVQEFLKDFSQIAFYKGMFPQSLEKASGFSNKRFALVNLDVDTYATTKAGLEFFYPRMSRGGVIVVHDYHSSHCLGVKQAVDEYMTDKPDTVFDLWSTQVAIAKFENVFS
jgi:O-methyltransferase